MATPAADDFPAIAQRMREIRAEAQDGGAFVWEAASGAQLDSWGALFGCGRRPMEADADYRQRIARLIGVVPGQEAKEWPDGRT